MYNILKDERGLALPMVFAVMLIVLSFGAAMLTMSTTESKIAQYDYDVQKAFYLADAGVSYGMNYVKGQEDQGLTINYPTTTTSFGGNGSFTLTINLNGSNWEITSQGQYRNVKKRITAKLLHQVNLLQFIQVGMFNAGGISSINMSGQNSYIKADIYGPNNLMINGLSNIYGNVYKSANYTNSILDISYYKENINTFQTLSSDYRELTSGANGIYKINAPYNISENQVVTYTGNKVLIIDGDLNVSGQFKLVSADKNKYSLLIIVTGNLNISGQAALDGCIYCKTLNCSGQGDLEGVLLANTANFSGKGGFTYSGNLAKNVNLNTSSSNSPGNMKISNWQITQ